MLKRNSLLILLLTLCLGCRSARPLFVGDVRVAGIKGLCHVLSYDDLYKYPLSVTRAKGQLAKDAGVTHYRMMGIPPWLFRDQEKLRRWQVRIAILRDSYDLQVIHQIEPDADTTIDQWRSHVARVIHEFPTQWYSIMNEPDNDPRWPPKRYARWLHVAAEELRRQRPFVSVLAPELGFGSASSPEEFLAALDPADFDIFTLHVYYRGWPHLHKCMDLVPKKPVIVSEDGADRRMEPVDAAIGGSYREYLAHPRIQGVFWYCLCDYAPECEPLWLVDMKLVDGLPAFEPRPSYEVFKGITCTPVVLDCVGGC